ncbi:carbohydrate ABC transporter permease [Zhihengliuella flava]|uniref:Alpha-glucoside transport system permease protein n=1 Tax=Zhihengliuella flava TaxID=1285193 RepID=A0A931D670_9MICC|nr:carbohydrate ABC transporter permease [Zhihengliuella flava]MBG6085169.1 alpha-glucoside transport system permease protein [Zhihengliuella flava]
MSHTTETRGRVSRRQRLELKSGRVKSTLTTRLASAAALVIAVLWTIPTFGLFVSSFREPDLIETTGWWTIFEHPGFTLGNYQEVLLSGSSSAPQLGEYFINSLFIAIPATLFPLVLASMAAYAFAWIKFKGSSTLFVLVFALQIVPLQLALIPLLQLTVTFLHPLMGGISDVLPFVPDQQYLPVWIAHTIFALPLAIFLLHNFIAEIPSDVIEAARVDGAGHGQIFLKIVLPLAMPAIASVAIFQFLWVWNDLLVALVFSSGTAETAPLTQRLAELAGSRGQNWARLTAGAFVSLIVPLIVFFSLQRYFVRGLLAGSAKG